VNKRVIEAGVGWCPANARAGECVDFGITGRSFTSPAAVAAGPRLDANPFSSQHVITRKATPANSTSPRFGLSG
jgi:hypothetical protein